MNKDPRIRAWATERGYRVLTSPILPIMLMVGFVILAAGVCSVLNRQAAQQVRRTVAREASTQVRTLEQRFHQHVRATERMARRFESNPDISRSDWQKDAREILKDYRFMEAIEWVDRDYRLRWVEPLAGHRKLIGFYVATPANGEPRSALVAGTRHDRTVFSGIIDLKQGGTGIASYTPIVSGGVSHGYISVVYRLSNLLGALASRDNGGFQVAVIEDGKVRFSLSWNQVLVPSLAESIPLNIPGIDWRLRLTPTQQWLRKNDENWPFEAFVGLLILGAMISGLVWLAQLTQIRNRSLRKARDRLENEIAEREAAQRDLARTETTDALTGLPNRRFFMEDLAHTLPIAGRHYRQAALVALDLDRFQLFNDSLGHQCGDELLVQVAGRLNQLNDEKVLVSYSSGDEFLFRQQQVNNIDDVIALLREIKRCFDPPFRIQGQDFNVTATMGVAIYPQSGLDPDVLMRNADVALYRAKGNGRNQYQFYTESMQNRETTRLQLDTELSQALREDQLVLHFQPQLDMSTGRIVGVEALVRWQHPTRGLLAPGEFIPLAEESGRIGEIGRWVTGAACRQLAAWRNTPFKHLRVAINLSGYELRDDRLVENIEWILNRNGVEAHQLEVELTEEIFVDNIDRNLEQLGQLHELGVHLAIDDFGTGYSSLAYLRHFPVDMLKVDRAFILGVTERHDDAAITRAVINLSHDLGIRVLAEGIETQAQLEFLQAHHCDLAQGFLISRPMLPEALEGLIERSIPARNPLETRPAMGG